ncbi:MAG: tryptophan 7-halogenase [Verrucomicrobiales bacterium]|nr:tryptophan 7-halogenase [Verrucomicrobiales bacterium]MCP5560697.1 tryptophan 7-halogenase [Verrucomicrobiaceae bacterium]
MTPSQSPSYDAIVIGGGPGGATAAMILARQGRKVLVLERERFPRFHIGESLLPYNRDVFEEIGILDEIEDGRFVVKKAAQFVSGDGITGARLIFGEGMFTEVKSALQVDRAIFDDMLLNRARSHGATVHEGATFLRHDVTDECATVRWRDVDGVEHTDTAAFVMDCSGMAAVTARQEGIRRERPGHRKVAVFGHFDDVLMPEDDEAGDTVLVVRDQSWAWFIPITEKRTSVGLVMDLAEFTPGKSDPEALFAHIVSSTPELQRRMAGAQRQGKIHVVVDYSFSVDRMVSPRLMRVGDAAGFMDPIFSSGVMLAMVSGRDAAHVIHAALTADEKMTAAMRRYERELRSKMDAFWEFVEHFYTRPFLELFLQPQARWNLPSAINAVLAGRPDQPWAVRWRLRLFFTLVRLQRFFPLVPRLPWGQPGLQKAVVGG